jgi:hypothetical protein
LLENEDGVPIDIAFAALPFEEEVVQRSTLFAFENGRSLRTCSAEDLLVLKLFAFRPRDVLDAESIAVRQRGHLDWPYIEASLQPLAEVKDQPEIMAALQKLRRSV